jgi:hypothetical protein
VTLAFSAASSKADQAAIAKILASVGKRGFAAAWLRAKGLAWAANLLPGGSAAPRPPRRHRHDPHASPPGGRRGREPMGGVA